MTKLNSSLARPPRGIVFDLDGTLVNSLEVTFEAFNHGIQSQGGKEHSAAEIMSYFGPGEEEIFAAILGREHAAAAYAACREHLAGHLGRVPLHAGVAELLTRLHLPLAIVTGRSWNTTEVILRHHGLLDRFVTVVANDHVAEPKPSPLGLRLAAERLGIDPAELLYVGDMAVDIQAARAAGARSVAALWDPMARREELAPHRPDFWAETALELLKLATP